MEKNKAIQIAQAVKAGAAHVFISEKNAKISEAIITAIFRSVGEAMDEAISAMDKISRIEDLVEGTIDHFDRDDALDMLYEVKSIISDVIKY